MTAAYYIVIVLHVIACLFLIGVVLLQQGKNQDLANAFGGGAAPRPLSGPAARPTCSPRRRPSSPACSW